MNPIIIIPTYNEKINVEKMIKKLFDEVFKDNIVSVLIVDSNSPDGTSETVEDLCKEYQNLHLLKQTEKKGLASAYIDGFKWALEKGYDVFAQMDCDFQHPPEILPDCIEKTKEYDLIIASRYVGNGKWGEENEHKRSQISEMGNNYAKWVLNCQINDMTGGFNIWTKKALEVVNLDKIMAKGYLFQIEMKYYAYKNNMKILEYPFIFGKRINGESKINIKIIIEAMTMIWKIRFANKQIFNKN